MKALLLSLSLALPALSAPVVLLDTFPADPLNSVAIGTSPLLGFPSVQVANSFTTGATPLSLTSVEAAIGFVSGFGDASGSNLSLGLFSDASGNPGSLLVALLPSQPLIQSGLVTQTSFLPASPTILGTNATFWVVAMGTGNSSIYTWSTVTGQGLGLGSIDGGVTWPLPATAGAMRVTADDQLAAGVPEIQPDSAAWPTLFCLALTAVLQSRRRSDRLRA